MGKNLLNLLVLAVFITYPAYAHGEQILGPFSADLIMVVASLYLVLKKNTGWKYRAAITLGAVFSIFMSWVLVEMIWSDFYYRLVGDFRTMTSWYYIIVWPPFLLICFLSYRFLKLKREPDRTEGRAA